MPEILYLSHYNSPLGKYTLLNSERGLVGLRTEPRMAVWLSQRKNAFQIQEDSGRRDRVIAELDAYFAGELQQFSVPLDLRGTEFQRQAWGILLNIPHGETWSYGQVARHMGRPMASRAVGRAVGTNPVSIIVPCHRVIGTDGDLVGYGGGLERKKALLELEARVAGRHWL
jgi:methylated-DNA-[protein]-cysteine S-methyltransferase